MPKDYKKNITKVTKPVGQVMSEKVRGTKKPPVVASSKKKSKTMKG